jgi:hypothetical protein
MRKRSCRSLTAAKNAALAPLRLFKRKEKPVLPAPGAAPAITSVESTKPAPAVAENFDSAATSQKADRVDAPDAEDLRRQEEARLRAEERARRKRAGGDKPRFY